MTFPSTQVKANIPFILFFLKNYGKVARGLGTHALPVCLPAGYFAVHTPRNAKHGAYKQIFAKKSHNYHLLITN